MLTLPITTATTERSFLQLRQLKTYLRSTMGQDWLNRLALLHVHREVKLNAEHIIDIFARKKARCLNIIL